MAALEAQAFGEKRDNYVSSSESEDDEQHGGASANNIPPPCSDGLPQVAHPQHTLSLFVFLNYLLLTHGRQELTRVRSANHVMSNV